MHAHGKNEFRPLFGRTWFCSVVLLLLAVLLLAACSSENGSPIRSEGESTMKSGPIVYVALGDSTGAGVGARNGGYVARLFKRLLDQRPGSELLNLCVSGATTDDVVRAQLQRGVAKSPDLVTVGIGINDIGHGFTIDQFAKNYEEILKTLQDKTQAPIVIMNIPDISSAPRIPGAMRLEYQRQIERFNERLEEIARRHEVTIVDLQRSSRRDLPSHPEYFSSDGFHPSDEGYETWAEQMWPTVAGVIGGS